MSTTPPSGGTGDVTITGDNNIVGDNNVLTNATTTNSPGATTTATTKFTENTSIEQGLRNGSTITLTGAGEPVSFTPSTGHMGRGETRRALTLASRDLAQAGITNPTPEQFKAALNGGAVTNPQGETSTLDGVLTLRSEGMGWGKVAQTIGVHPGQSDQAVAHSRRSFGGFEGGAGALASVEHHDGSRDHHRRHEHRGFGSFEGGAAALASVGPSGSSPSPFGGSERNGPTGGQNAMAISSSSTTINGPGISGSGGTPSPAGNGNSQLSSPGSGALNAGSNPTASAAITNGGLAPSTAPGNAATALSVSGPGSGHAASTALSIGGESAVNGPAHGPSGPAHGPGGPAGNQGQASSFGAVASTGGPGHVGGEQSSGHGHGQGHGSAPGHSK